VVPDLYYDARRVAELAAIFSELAAGDACVDAATFRDRLAIGRKRSIQILEFFDRVGYTRRRGLGRILRTSAGWGAAR
jgi:selenocysteine-specific elongation factor